MGSFLDTGLGYHLAQSIPHVNVAACVYHVQLSIGVLGSSQSFIEGKIFIVPSDHIAMGCCRMVHQLLLQSVCFYSDTESYAL